ncbi:hypothetical protein WN51_12135 [Melipona quadrifasciata]|uniref:Uncharacterized protein n=1 Tax=Melipona quadrifasciata TaxID=166423 RepID=A0A0N0BHL7_9HYME|nr:hypothetical protein WN51_12135 [Melipona quadrifasciata]
MGFQSKERTLTECYNTFLKLNLVASSETFTVAKGYRTLSFYRQNYLTTEIICDAHSNIYFSTFYARRTFLWKIGIEVENRVLDRSQLCVYLLSKNEWKTTIVYGKQPDLQIMLDLESGKKIIIAGPNCQFVKTSRNAFKQITSWKHNELQNKTQSGKNISKGIQSQENEITDKGDKRKEQNEISTLHSDKAMLFEKIESENLPVSAILIWFSIKLDTTIRVETIILCFTLTNLHSCVNYINFTLYMFCKNMLNFETDMIVSTSLNLKRKKYRIYEVENSQLQSLRTKVVKDVWERRMERISGITIYNGGGVKGNGSCEGCAVEGRMVLSKILDAVGKEKEPH